VLLVPGWFATGRLLAPLRIRLIGAGWPDDRVVALTFTDPTGSNRDHAREIAAAVDSLRARTGAERVDIVAHSMGGLATRLYLKEGGAARTRRVVFLATPQKGTYTAYLAFGEGREEMIPGSDFLEELNHGPALPPGVEALTIRSMVDMHVLPEENATLPGVPDVEICCPTHHGLLADMDAFRAVRRFLADGVTTTKGSR
jgi:triacylglycerol lipase